MADNEIIQEATEAVTKGLPCAFLVQPLLEVVKSQKATIERQAEAIQQGYKLATEHKAEIERLQKENEFHRKTITENAQRALEVLVDEIDKAKSEAYREFAERLKPILKEMFDLMIDDDEGKCIIENCKKHSSIPCMNEYCIKENWQAWGAKVDKALKELTEKND